MVGSYSCDWLYDIVLVCHFVFCNHHAEEGNAVLLLILIVF